MSTLRFLDYEVALLLARYGKEAVIPALARRAKQSESDIEAFLDRIPEETSKPRRSKKPSSALDRIEGIIASHPDRADQLRAMRSHFDNRSFLPELRDVKRFFQQHGRDIGRPKSRQECLPKLLNLLAELDSSELPAFGEGPERGRQSSLGIISDEILGRDKK